jgi:ABC-type antimicrobial peptide transport system permease subunit
MMGWLMIPAPLVVAAASPPGAVAERTPSMASRRSASVQKILAAFVLALLPFCAATAASAQDAKDRYRSLAAQVDSRNLRSTVTTLAGLGSRVPGYPGEAKAAEFVEGKFREYGLTDVRVEEFEVAVPMDRGASIRIEGAEAGISGRPFKLHALWPNLVRTSQLPKGGLRAPLIYVGDGKLANFNGKDVEGRIVLADFNSRAEWLNAPRLGAKAVIFIAPETTMRGEAEAKFVSIPISIPRFWISRSEVVPLLAATSSGTEPTCVLESDMPWERHRSKNIFGKIEGTDPKLKDQIIVIQGYYDSISVVPALAPGAESACGIAALLELARIYSRPENRPGRTLYFVATSAHHLALQGIREFINAHIDEWARPSMAEKAVAKENAGRTAIYLTGSLLLFLFWLAMRILKSPAPAAPEASETPGKRVRFPFLGRLNAGSWVLASLVLILVVLNVLFYANPRDKALRKPDTIYLWAGLDLTSQTRAVGIFYKGWFYDFREDIQGRFSDIARVCRENADKIGGALGFDPKKAFADGVNPVDGKNWRNYIPGKPAFDSEVVTMAQGIGVTFASIDDARQLVDTPFDTPDRVNVANLAFQTRLLACQFYHIVTDTNEPGDVNAQRMPITEPANWSRMALQGGFATIRGRVAIFDPKKSFIAYTAPKLANSLVVIRNRTKSYMGVRGNMIQVVYDEPETGQKNVFEFRGCAPLTAFGGNAVTRILAFHIDSRETLTDPETGEERPNPSLGEIDYAPDLGVSGAKYMPLDISVTTATKEVPIILFRCVPTAIFDLVDQQSLRALATIDILDGSTNGEPQRYGYMIDPQDPWMVGSYVEDMAVIFADPGTRLKIMMGAGPAATRFLLINPTYDPNDPYNRAKRPDYRPEGIGYLVAGDPREAQDAELRGAAVGRIDQYDPKREIARGGAIYHTAFHVAKDMWSLNDSRIKRLEKYRIVNQGINELHERAWNPRANDPAKRGALERARVAMEQKDWETFHHASRAAWGFESRAYPDVQRTSLDVVQGVLFYLALLIPFAYFMERLVFGSYDLKRQISYAFLIFMGIFLLFSQVHPAFDITMNPVIVLLAFIMGALSVIVIMMIGGKFEEQLKLMNREVSGVHKADIGRVSVAVAAFNLGISNMRRRKARTILTCITLVLLTFTVLSFTSVVQTMRFNQVPSPGTPRYNGLMIRTAMWDQLQEPAYRLLADEYGRNFNVAPRSWFFGTQLGEQSFLTIKRADRQYDAKALVGLTPQEARVTRPQEALITGRWFEPGDTYSVILPDAIAAALRIDPQDVGKATVSYSGVDYTVVGILDSQRLKSVMDLDNEPLTPVDFILMQKLTRQGKAQGGETGFREYTHLEPDSVFFVPYQTATNLGAELRSIAIDFGDAKMVTETLGPLMHRLGLNLYAGRIPTDGSRPTIERYSSIAATSSKGLELVFFPVLIAALIVLNTMLGSVFERVKEIHIFSSIGLAPSHIAMLFIAEAMVYAILGSVAGYLLGQFATKILVWTGAFEGLYLNFSSVSAVLTTLVVVGVVLLSTLYPARKAAEVATPAIDRTWRVPEPEGDEWTIPLPFSVTGEQAKGLNSFLSEWFAAYEEYSIGDFVTQNVETEEFNTAPEGMPELKGYRIRCMAWLAPFDLGVSQRVVIETLPTTMADVFDIRVIIHRESGDISNWKRVNRRFLNTLRKQFLIWRTLKQGERERYLEQGTAEKPSVAGGGLQPQPAD